MAGSWLLTPALASSITSAIAVPCLRGATEQARQARNESRHICHVSAVIAAEGCDGLALLVPRQLDVHYDQHRKRGEREKRWPLHKKTDQDENEPTVLRMAGRAVRPRGPHAAM